MSSESSVTARDLVLLAVAEMSALEHDRNHTASAVKICVHNTCSEHELGNPPTAAISRELGDLTQENLLYWEPVTIKSGSIEYNATAFRLLDTSAVLEAAEKTRHLIASERLFSSVLKISTRLSHPIE